MKIQGGHGESLPGDTISGDDVIESGYRIFSSTDGWYLDYILTPLLFVLVTSVVRFGVL